MLYLFSFVDKRHHCIFLVTLGPRATVNPYPRAARARGLAESSRLDLVRADSPHPGHTVISSVTLIEQRVSSLRVAVDTKSTRPLKGEQILSVQKECVYLWSRTPYYKKNRISVYLYIENIFYYYDIYYA